MARLWSIGRLITTAFCIAHLKAFASVSISEISEDLARRGWTAPLVLTDWRVSGEEWQPVVSIEDAWRGLAMAATDQPTQWRTLAGATLQLDPELRDFAFRLRCNHKKGRSPCALSTALARAWQTGASDAKVPLEQLRDSIADPQLRWLAIWQAAQAVDLHRFLQDDLQIEMESLAEALPDSADAGLLPLSILRRGYATGTKPAFLADWGRRAARSAEAEALGLATAIWIELLFGTTTALREEAFAHVQAHCDPLDWTGSQCALALALHGRSLTRTLDLAEGEAQCRRAHQAALAQPQWLRVSTEATACLAWLEDRYGQLGLAEQRLRSILQTIEGAGMPWPVRVRALIGLSSNLRQQGDLDAAAALLTEARETVAERIESTHLLVINALAAVEMARGRSAEAEAHFREVARRSNDEVFRVVAQNNLGWLLAEQDRWQEAKEAIQTALEWIESYEGDPGIAANLFQLSARIADAEEAHVAALQWWDRALEARRRAGSDGHRLAALVSDRAATLDHLGRAAEALQAAAEAVRLIDEQIDLLRDDELLRLEFRDSFRQIYLRWIDLQLRHADAAAVLASVDRFRRQSLRRLAERRTDGQDESAGTRPASSGSTAQLSYQRLLEGWLLIVRVGDTITVKRLATSPEVLEGTVAAWRRQLAFPPTPEGVAVERQLARTLFRELLAPVADQLQQVEVLELDLDGPLQGIPFAALLQDDNCHQACRLVERYTISERSGTTLTVRLPAHPRILAVGAPTGTDILRSDLRNATWPAGALPGALRELAALRNRFADRVTILQQDEASEAQLRRNLQRADILHLATHAVPDRDRPLGSFLLLRPGSDLHQSKDDGRLEASELLEMNLSGKLVILAGCETAIGPSSESDGMLGLRYAIHAAGAGAVIATLWQVNDQQTAELVTDFYGGLKREFDPAHALRAAQTIALARSGLHAHPHYWAGLTISQR